MSPIRVGRTCNHLVVRMWQPRRTGSLRVPDFVLRLIFKEIRRKRKCSSSSSSKIYIPYLWDLFFTSGSSCASRVAGSVVYHLFLFLFSLLDNEHWGVVSLLLVGGWWKKGATTIWQGPWIMQRKRVLRWNWMTSISKNALKKMENPFEVVRNFQEFHFF